MCFKCAVISLFYRFIITGSHSNVLEIFFCFKIIISALGALQWSFLQASMDFFYISRVVIKQIDTNNARFIRKRIWSELNWWKISFFTRPIFFRWINIVSQYRSNVELIWQVDNVIEPCSEMFIVIFTAFWFSDNDKKFFFFHD